MADLMYAAVIEKLTNEDWDEEFDFEGFIPEGTTVTAYTVKITRADKVNTTNDMWSGPDSSISSQTVTLSLNSASTETAYIIDVHVTASDLSKAHLVKLLCVTEPGMFR